MRPRTLLIAFVAALVGLTGPANAAMTLLNHDTSDTENDTALCLAAPERETGRIVVTRIRITGSRSTPTTYTFAHKRTSDSLFDVEDLSGANCSAPGCAVLLAVEGVTSGRPMDLTGLSLELPAGSRLYMYTDADIGSDTQTVEVFYRPL